jgi:hypothetical protein
MRQVTREIRKSLCVDDICATTTHQLGNAFNADRCVMYLCKDEPASFPSSPRTPTTGENNCSTAPDTLCVDRLSEYVRDETNHAQNTDKPPLNFIPGYFSSESLSV